MTTKALAVVVVFSVLLLGCSGAGIKANQPEECNSHECNIDVSVVGDCGDARNILVDPPELRVPSANKQAIIHWNLLTDGFKFDDVDKGITFSPPPPMPPGEFHHPVLANQGTKYNLTNANTRPNNYKYNIQLLRANGAKCERKDPQIRNG